MGKPFRSANILVHERYRQRRLGLLLALVSKLSTATRRLLIGRPFRSDRLSHTLLPKRIALPVFASDALSSVAYAPEEVFLMLSVAGVSAYALTPWIGLAVAAVMLVVVASYRQNVHAYPGGGDYEVVTTNLGETAGLVVASALMVDYVLTVAVSTASAMANIGSAIPIVAEHKVFFCVASILLVMALNLRGVRESGVAFAIPTYAFIIGVLVMIGWGLFRIFVLGDPLRAESAGFRCTPNTARSSVSRWRSWWRGRSPRGVRRLRVSRRSATGCRHFRNPSRATRPRPC